MNSDQPLSLADFKLLSWVGLLFADYKLLTVLLGFAEAVAGVTLGALVDGHHSSWAAKRLRRKSLLCTLLVEDQSSSGSSGWETSVPGSELTEPLSVLSE